MLTLETCEVCWAILIFQMGKPALRRCACHSVSFKSRKQWSLESFWVHRFTFFTANKLTCLCQAPAHYMCLFWHFSPPSFTVFIHAKALFLLVNSRCAESIVLKHPSLSTVPSTTPHAQRRLSKYLLSGAWLDKGRQDAWGGRKALFSYPGSPSPFLCMTDSIYALHFWLRHSWSLSPLSWWFGEAYLKTKRSDAVWKRRAVILLRLFFFLKNYLINLFWSPDVAGKLTLGRFLFPQYNWHHRVHALIFHSQGYKQTLRLTRVLTLWVTKASWS